MELYINKKQNILSKQKKTTMKNYEIISEKEEKNKKRGLMITMFFHSTLLAMAFFPIMNAMNDIELQEPAIEYIELVAPDKPEMEFIANAETQTRKNESNQPPKSQEVEPVPEKPAPEPVEEPAAKPVEVVEDNEAPAVSTSEDHTATEVKQVEAPKPVVKPTPKPSPTVKPAPSPTPSNTSTVGGNAANNTHNSGDGGADEDLQEGVFGRRVMHRPNIKGLTKKKGKIAIKVCVSQEGTVIASKYLQKLSTIYEPELIANAMRAARRHKFDVDYSAPKKQWGKLTFIFDLK